jgi:hypothetical protein
MASVTPTPSISFIGNTYLVVRFSAETERADFLNVLAAERRELRLTMTTDRPLRQGRSPSRRRQLEAYRATVARQIDFQLDARGRRAFRGRIAVELRLGVPRGGRDDAGLPALVKAYLDVLKGPVVFDDSTVDHLLVLRQPAETERTVVFARCLPLAIFAAEYDRAFRLLSELETLPDERQARFVNFAPVDWTWGLDHYDQDSRDINADDEFVLSVIDGIDRQEAELLDDDPDADLRSADFGIPDRLEELIDPSTRDYWRDFLREKTGLARGEELTDLGFDARDRPGTAPAWLEQAQALDAADLLELSDQAPGCFILPSPPTRPTPPERPDWADLVCGVFAERASTEPWRRARFGGPVALDIALRGNAGRHLDVDNLAHRVLREFERAFGTHMPQIGGYRVYRRPAASNDVRVRVLPAVRLGLLSRVLDDAHALVRG